MQDKSNPFVLSTDAYESDDPLTTINTDALGVDLTSFEPVTQQPYKTAPPTNPPPMVQQTPLAPSIYSNPQQPPQQQHQNYSPQPPSSSENDLNGTNSQSYGTATNNETSSSLWGRCLSCLTGPINYETYFDIDTLDIQTRIIGSVRYFNVTDAFWDKILFTDKDSSNVNRSYDDSAYDEVNQSGMSSSKSIGAHRPDAYGPFWITTTLIFIVAVTSNIMQYVHNEKEDFGYDVKVLVRAIWTFYGFGLCMPFIIFMSIKCLLPSDQNLHLSLIDIICLYGYSFVSYIPGCILCGLIPLEFFAWIFLLVPTFISCIFILRNLVGAILGRPDYQNLNQGGSSSGISSDADLELLYAASADRKARGGPILGCIVASHVIFYFIFKLGFYRVVHID